MSDIVDEVLEARYLREGETSWDDICWRVANYVGDSEEERKVYFEIIKDKNFVPNSPTLMNAGTETPMLSACYAFGMMDDIESILRTFYNAMMVMKYGGGVGIDYSNLRPKGDPIKSTGGTSSGVVSFMEMFNQGVETVKSGGKRRGAAIASLDVSHPDIEEFIASKLEEGKLSNMNISVRIPDAFMEAVEGDDDWDLVFDGKIYRTIRARDLFKKIVYGAWRYGEPGVLFVDEIKRKEPYIGNEFQIGQNPCVTGDTLILTSEGYKRIDECVDKETTIWNGSEWSNVVPAVTGENQEIMEIGFSDGSVLKCTPYHGFKVFDRKDYSNKNVVNKEAKDLVVGDKLIECDYPIIEGIEELEDAYTHGFYSGSGYYDSSRNKHIILLYGVMKKFVKYFKISKIFVSPYSDSKIVLFVDGNYDKTFVPDCRYSIKSRLEWLAGIIDSNGHKNLKTDDISILSVDKDFLLKIKLMLNTLGINATVDLMIPPGMKILPDEIGCYKKYECLGCFALTISAMHLEWLVGLGLETHRVSMTTAYKTDTYKYKHIEVVSINKSDKLADKVYCFNEPKNHTGIFNSVITSQCGETNLLTCKNGGESCNLGSINLSNYYDKRSDTIKIDDIASTTRTVTRFLNNIIDKNFYPVPEIERMTKDFRRIGIGVMGWHDLLIKCNICYGSEASLELAEAIMQIINKISINESEVLAKQLNKTFPRYNECNIATPRYNIATTVIAPTGTISLLAGCSSGIEPIFNLVYKRYTWVDGKKVGYLQVHSLFEEKLDEYLKQHCNPTKAEEIKKDVLEHAYNKGTIQDIKYLPVEFRKLFRTSLDISPKEHVDMQAAFQKYTANNISKTINLPKDTTEKEIWDIYFYGWEKKLKGMTVYRSGSRDVEVLELNKEKSTEQGQNQTITAVTTGRILPKRPRDLPATNCKRRSGCGKLIISVAENNGKPYETIIKNKGGCDAMNDAIGQLISLAMRWNIPTWDIIKTLRNVTCPVAYKKFGKGEADGKSCADIIGRVIEELVPDDIDEYKTITNEPTAMGRCPECGEPLKMIEGCRSCICGYSKCM